MVSEPDHTEDSSIISEFLGREDDSEFYHFEPWDVAERDDYVKEQARKDGILLYDPTFTAVYGEDPKPFQAGYALDSEPLQIINAGTQVGKSYCALICMICELTGEIPISMRYEAGVATPYKRRINEGNIQRFGRFNKETGEFIDRGDPSRLPDLSMGFDCGCIVGVGKFPKEKIAPRGSKCWIGTTAKAWDEYWWPRFAEETKRIIPEHLIDKKRGTNGFNIRDNLIYLIGGSSIRGITYEMTFKRFEAENVWRIILDEEPDDNRIFVAAQEHCKWLSIVMTPYNGVTWSRELVFKKSPGIAIYHASQYDSPYQDRNRIEIRRSRYAEWEIEARVWGLYSEQRGKPYYNRPKINGWLRAHTFTFEYARFMVMGTYTSMIELMGLKTFIETIHEPSDDIKLRDTWEVYERPAPGVAYWVGVDLTKGADWAGGTMDYSAAIIMRGPTKEEEKQGRKNPVMVAAIRSYLEAAEFSNVVIYACRAYNNALLCAETGMGEGNATFLAYANDYPFWYKMTVIRDADRKTIKKIGFDTNVRTRRIIFDLIGTWIKTTEGDHGIRCQYLLRELASCMKGEKGRPDHPHDGTLDMAVAWGICLYIWEHAREQIICYGGAFRDDDDMRIPGGPRFPVKEPEKPKFYKSRRSKSWHHKQALVR